MLFSHFSPIFPSVPHKYWAFHSSYKLLFRLNMEKGYPLKKFRLDKLKITVSVSNCKRTVFSYVSCKKPLKAPVTEWLPLWKNKRYLIETFKDEPIPHKNFTFLRQGSYEIIGGSARPPPPVSDVVPKPLVSEGFWYHLRRLRSDLLHPKFGNQKLALLWLKSHDFSGTWHISTK